MNESDNQANSLIAGFFLFFGFSENPAEKMSKDLYKKPSSTKIKDDLRKIKQDYRKAYKKVLEDIYG